MRRRHFLPSLADADDVTVKIEEAVLAVKIAFACSAGARLPMCRRASYELGEHTHTSNHTHEHQAAKPRAGERELGRREREGGGGGGERGGGHGSRCAARGAHLSPTRRERCKSDRCQRWRRMRSDSARATPVRRSHQPRTGCSEIRPLRRVLGGKHPRRWTCSMPASGRCHQEC